jgi:hypothetical protein
LKEQQEKVMTKSIRTLSLAVAVTVLSSSMPAFAAQQDSRPRPGIERPSIVVIVKRIVKRVFGITTNEDITIPKP